MKTSEGGKRYPLNMRTTKETRDRLEKAAAESGRSLTQELEFQLERALQFDRTLAAMNKTVEEIQRGNLEAELMRQDYSFERTEYGRIWFPPGFPGDRSPWITPKEKSEK